MTQLPNGPAGCGLNLGHNDVLQLVHIERVLVTLHARLQPQTIDRNGRWQSVGQDSVVPKLILEDVAHFLDSEYTLHRVTEARVTHYGYLVHANVPLDHLLRRGELKTVRKVACRTRPEEEAEVSPVILTRAGLL